MCRFSIKINHFKPRSNRHAGKSFMTWQKGWDT